MKEEFDSEKIELNLIESSPVLEDFAVFENNAIFKRVAMLKT